MEYDVKGMFTKGSKPINKENSIFFQEELKMLLPNVDYALFYPKIFTRKDVGKIPRFFLTEGKEYQEHFNKFCRAVYSTLLFVNGQNLINNFSKSGLTGQENPLIVLGDFYAYLIKEVPSKNNEKVILIVLVELPLDFQLVM